MKTTWGIVGCGWLGMPLAKLLIKQGHNVHGSSRSMSKVKQLLLMGIEGHQLQQANFNTPHTWLSKLDILVLNIPPSQFGESYATAMVNIAKQVNMKCWIIFVSSTSVYPNLNGKVDESTPAVGTNRNGPIIHQAEEKLRASCKSRLTILRMAGMVGGNRNPIKYLAGKTRSGGNEPVNLVHREDCIGIIQKVVEQAYWGKILNVCATHHPSRKVYYEETAQAYGLPTPLFIPGEKKDYKIVSNLRSRNELGYRYTHDHPLQFPFENSA